MACSVDQHRESLLRYAEARSSGSPDLARLEAEALAANLGIARSFAWSVAKGRSHREDVEAAASVALLESIRTWSADGGAALSTWAWGPMMAAFRKVAALTQAVAVPVKTLRTARAIAASGEDVDTACARLGKRSAPVKAALSVWSCELTDDLGATSMESTIFEDEMERLLEEAAACWRGPNARDRLLRAAESLARRRAELLASEKVTEATRATAEALWPSDDEERVRVLSRLDYVLTVAHRGRKNPRQQATTAIDLECWRAHFVEGEMWAAIGEWLGGVSRTRAQNRAKRSEKWIAKYLQVAAEIPDEALEVWARRPAEVVELERLGILDSESDPLTILYAVEDLEVALTEIDERLARVWTARAHGLSLIEIGAAEGLGRKTARRLGARADAALRELLQVVGEAVQLELFSSEGSTWTDVVWWSPLAKEAAPTISIRVRPLRAVRARRIAGRVSARAIDPTSGAPVDDLGSAASPGSIGCTGPPDGARASPMLC